MTWKLRGISKSWQPGIGITFSIISLRNELSPFEQQPCPHQVYAAATLFFSAQSKAPSTRRRVDRTGTTPSTRLSRVQIRVKEWNPRNEILRPTARKA